MKCFIAELTTCASQGMLDLSTGLGTAEDQDPAIRGTGEDELTDTTANLGR
jgi:hypothetical protein